MWNTIICDEATRISNSRSQQSKLIKTIPAEHRIAMTGTPLNNSVQDIWNILDFCHPGLLGTYYSFTEKYCQKNRWGGIVSYKNLNDLKKHISDYMIRRKKSEVLQELPDKMFETIYVELSSEERKIYNAVKNEISKELKEHEINKNINENNLSNIMVKMIRLKQITGSVELISDLKYSSKVEALKELLKDIMQKDSKVIVFTQFAKMAKILHRELKEYNALTYMGETTNEDRYDNIKNFNEDNVHKILIMTNAGNEGLNIQRSNYIIHFDMSWSISKLEQREGRCHRIGQKSAVTVYKLIVQKSIDEYVWKVLRKKQLLSEDILGDKERIKKVKLSKKDIKMILK